MADQKPTLLLVEDDVDVADMLEAYFRGQGYGVILADTGEAGVSASRSKHPDLVILDIRLPDIDGYEVARRLRTNRRTEDIPIIFLTEKRERTDRLRGLGIGGDDYVTKPFDIQELRLRVRNALRRTSQGPLTNPVTGLAEGSLVDERLAECLSGNGWAMLLVSLKNLDEFRETYGFVASDDVQRAVSLLIHNSVRGVGGPNDFVGQISATDFLLVTVPASLAALEERISARLEQALEFFYPLTDRGPDRPRAPEKRLEVKMARVLAKDGPFEGPEGLKSRLMQMVA